MIIETTDDPSPQKTEVRKLRPISSFPAHHFWPDGIIWGRGNQSWCATPNQNFFWQHALLQKKGKVLFRPTVTNRNERLPSFRGGRGERKRQRNPSERDKARGFSNIFPKRIPVCGKIKLFICLLNLATSSLPSLCFQDVCQTLFSCSFDILRWWRRPNEPKASFFPF